MDHGTSLLKGGTKLSYRKFDLEEKQFKTCTCSTIRSKNRNIVRHPSKGQKLGHSIQYSFKVPKPSCSCLIHQSPYGCAFSIINLPANSIRNMHADVCLWLLRKKTHHLLPIGVRIFSNMKGVDGERGFCFITIQTQF